MRTALAMAALVFAGCAERSVPPPAAPMAELPAVVVRPETTPVERQLDGTIEAVNQGTVSAQTAGRVAEIFYDVNDFVPAGAVILRLRSTEQRAGLTQAGAALREAEAREAEAQTQYQRIADMYQRKVVPRAKFDEATANRAAAQARLVAARAAVAAAREGVGYTEVRAPYAGVVTRRHVEVGESVAPGTALMSGLSLQFLRVAVDVPQSIVSRVRSIKRAAVYVDGRRIEAARLTVFPVASAAGTFRARLDLPENAADLYPGMLVKVGFVVGEAERLLVPASSLVERGEVTAVYVLDPAGRASMRQVRIGRRFGERIEVLAGLTADEKVALDPLAAVTRLAPATRAAGAED